MPSTASIPSQHATQPQPQHVRAKTLSCTSRAFSPLGAALLRSGVSVRALAEAWGVQHSYVARVANGDVPLSLDVERLAATPASVLKALAAILDDYAESRSLQPPTPLQAALRHNEVKGRFDGALAPALADGVLDEDERRTLVPLAAAVVETAVILRRAVEGGK